MKFSQIIDSIQGILNHLRLSYRAIIITSIGLIISVSIISTSIILLNTQQATIITDTFNYRGFESYSTTALYSTQNYYQNLNDWALTINNYNLQSTSFPGTIISSINQSLLANNLLNKVSEIKSLYISRSTYTLYNLSTDSLLLNNFFITEISNISYLKPYLESGSTLVESSNNLPAAILIALSDSKLSSTNLPQIGAEYQLDTAYLSPYGTYIHAPLVNISISGRAIITTNEFANFVNKGNYLPFYTTKYILVVQNITSFLSTLSNYIKILPDQNIDYGFNFIVYYNFYTSQLNSFDPNSILSSFQSFDLAVGNKLYLNGYTFFSLQDNLYNRIKAITLDINTMIAFDLIFSIPIICIAIFLVYYSFSLVHNREYLQLRIYLTRGISKIQYLLNLFSEIILSFAISFIGGFLVSLPLAALVVNTSGYLEFNNFKVPIVSITNIFPILFVVDAFLVVAINILRVYKLSTLTIGGVDSEIAKEHTEPFWKRKYLDFIFLTTGIVFYILYLFSVSTYAAPTTTVDAGAFQNFIVIPTPILILLGSVMVSARLYPIIVGRLSRLVWNHNASLLSYSLKNIVRRKQSVIRAILILAINMAFVISFLTFPFSYQTNIEQSVLYTVGSDMYVPLAGSFDSNFTNFEGILTNVTHTLVNISDQIQAYTPIITATLNGYNILALNTSTFLSSAYMRNDFAPNLIGEIHKLDLTNTSVLVYNPNFNTLNLSIGQEFIWPSSSVTNNISNLANLNFKFVPQGVFNYWPRLLTTVPHDPSNHFYAIMSFNTYNNLDQLIENHQKLMAQLYPNQTIVSLDVGLHANVLGMYIKLANNANESTIINTLIQHITGINNIEVAHQLLQNVLYTKVINQYLLGAVNNDIIFCIAIATLVIIIFSILQIIERGKEIAIERAVGMTFKQNCLLIIYDTSWLLLFGLVSGIILGLAFASLFLIPVTTYGQIPPLLTIYPFNLIIETTFLVIIIPSLINFIPALITSRIEITRLLKVE